MKKFSLFIIVLLLIVFFAGADYLVNTPETIDQTVLKQISGENTLRQIIQETNAQNQVDANKVELMLASDRETHPYTLEKRDATHQLFEAFDISSLTNVRVYKSSLVPLPGQETREPITVYEVSGPKNQGKVTYLSVKLRMLAQVGPTESINETNDFGESSLYYNEDNIKSVGFLLVQIKDSLFGFQYSKQNDSAFRDVSNMIETLMAFTAN